MKSVLTILIIILYANAYSQHTEPEPKQDTVKATYLEEVVVSANKIPEQRRTVSQQIKIIAPSIILSFNAQTSADLLQNTGLVAIQKSQQGGGSPMLRGFEASRVLLMIDGVRMNNLIYRAGHLQNAVTVDNNALDRVEILFGPSSTVYGSDALGGVVHFYTRTPELAKEKSFLFSGNAFTRYGSVNNEKTGHLDFTLSGKKLGSLTSFTFSDFGDLKMGEKINPAFGENFGLRPYSAQRKPDNSGDELIANRNPYIQKSSGYQQYDFVQKILFDQNNHIRHLFNLQFSTSSNIPRYDRLTDAQAGGLRPAWYYGPQKRLLTSYQLKVKELGVMADALTAIISYQNIEESRHDRKFNNNNLNHRTENIDVFAMTLDLQKILATSKIQYGFDSQFNRLKSSAYKEDITTQATSPLSTRYPNGSNSMGFIALYFTNIHDLTPNLTMISGGRMGISGLNSTFVNDGSFTDLPFSKAIQNNIVSSATTGLIYRPDLSWKISLHGSSGFRTPNVDDLAKIFDPTQGTVVVPNKYLEPEKTVSLELGVTKHFLFGLTWENNFYSTHFTDIIVTDDFTFQGQDSIFYDGTLSKVQANQNKGKAYLWGYSTVIKADLGKNISVTGSLNYTYGRIGTDTTHTPLDHIPPLFGRFGVQYIKGKFRSEVFSNFNGWKRIKDYYLNGEDNEAYATIKGMPSWYTVNIRMAFEINKRLALQAGIDNLLDLQYRTFASGINAPGRNIFGTLRVRF